mgnify:CR=1 FL=1
MRDLATLGVWTHTEALPASDSIALAQRIESLGYSTLWLPETMGKDPFALIGMLGATTTELRFATGIANIFHRHAGVMKQAANTLAEQTGGRFILGMGVSHGPVVAGVRGLAYSKPLASMKNYLSAYDASPYMAYPPAEAPKLDFLEFRLRAPQAKQVSLVGEFNGWKEGTLALPKRENGAWDLSLPLPKGRYGYLFVVDGKPQLDAQNPETALKDGKKISLKILP